jgi:hypothetical protein
MHVMVVRQQLAKYIAPGPRLLGCFLVVLVHVSYTSWLDGLVGAGLDDLGLSLSISWGGSFLKNPGVSLDQCMND